MSSKRRTLMAADSDNGVSAFAANDDLLTEILLRLPAKSVTALKLVSKHWLHLISSDQFHRLHALRHHNPQPSLILRTRTAQFFCLNSIANRGKPKMMPHNFDFPNPKILSSSNGLLLLHTDIPKSEYHVYNPATRQSRQIHLDFDLEYPSTMGLNIAFDPPHYKIVCVRASRKGLPDARPYRVEIYDSVSHTWRTCLDELFFVTNTDNNFYGVHCNKSIYWKMTDAILYFDMDKNAIGSMPYPQIPWSEDRKWAIRHSQLQESNGHLYLFTIGRDDQIFALWKLQRGGDGGGEWWLLKYYDDSQSWLLNRIVTGWPISVLRFISGSDGGEEALVTHVPGKIRIYRFDDESGEELVDLTDQPFYHSNSLQFDWENVYQCDESLSLFD